MGWPGVGQYDRDFSVFDNDRIPEYNRINLEIRSLEYYIEKLDLVIGMPVFGAIRIGFEVIRVEVDNNLSGGCGMLMHKKHTTADNHNQQDSLRISQENPKLRSLCQS